MANETNTPDGLKPTGFVDRALDIIERVGNKLPDPAALFLLLLFVVWILSALLSSVSFAEIDPRNGKPLVVNNQLSGTAIANFLSSIATTFTCLHPLGLVLFDLLGVRVAEHNGMINHSLKALLHFTSSKHLTQAHVFIGVLSSTAVDAG